MAELPPSFTVLHTAGNTPATSLVEDYINSATPERKAAFVDAIRAIGDRQREAFARDSNIVLGGTVIDATNIG